ncbi:transposase [Pleurocapsales cyanobacterium LEGE 06147]|nr:transposase [Pleurocapsales cyanobacterium LEGE 06147]
MFRFAIATLNMTFSTFQTTCKQLNDRLHICDSCNTVICRDLNASINIKNRAVGHSVLKANPRIQSNSWSW